MNAWKPALLLPLLLLAASMAMAAARYGEAVLEKGEMLILREGQRLSFDTPNESVPVNEQDLIRVRDDSRVVLQSREKATITLGANAVFHVKPWESREEKGFARMLFGRFRAAIIGLVGGERFNVKTATATIGVKGTEYRATVQPQGETMLIVEESDPSLQGLEGPLQDVGPGFLSLAGVGIPATPPAEPPPEVQDQFGPGQLDAPAPNSPDARRLPGEEGLIRAGIVTEEQLENAAQEQVELDLREVDLGEIPTVDFDLEDAKDNLFRGNLDIRFQQ